MGIRIVKEKIPVVVILGQFRIEGEMHVVAGGRILDEINKERDFIPLTHVSIYDAIDGKPIDTVEFIIMNKHSITLLAPTSSSSPSSGTPAVAPS